MWFSGGTLPSRCETLDFTQEQEGRESGRNWNLRRNYIYCRILVSYEKECTTDPRSSGWIKGILLMIKASINSHSTDTIQSDKTRADDIAQLAEHLPSMKDVQGWIPSTS